MADDVEQYRQIILVPGYDSKTSVFGLVCSADNGQTFKVYWTPYGRVWYPEDASSFFPLLWPYIEEKIKAGGFKQDEVVNWSDIQGRPDVALKSDLPDLSKFAKTSDIPKVDLSGYAKITDIPNDLVHTKDLADYVKTKNLPKPPDLSGYAKRSDITGLATKAEAQQVQSTADSASTTAESAKSIAQQAQSTAVDASSKAEQAIMLANDAKPKIDSSSQMTIKKPSEYPEGFSYEIKTFDSLSIDESEIATELVQGKVVWLTTKKYSDYVRQTAEVIDGPVPATFFRNGTKESWSNWVVSQLTAFS